MMFVSKRRCLYVRSLMVFTQLRLHCAKKKEKREHTVCTRALTQAESVPGEQREMGASKYVLVRGVTTRELPMR